MPAMPAVVHVAGRASTSTLPATQARSAAKITRAQADRQGLARGDPGAERTEGDDAQAQELEHDGEVEARHLYGGVGGDPGERTGEDREHGARDDGEDGVTPQGAAQQAVG